MAALQDAGSVAHSAESVGQRQFRPDVGAGGDDLVLRWRRFVGAEQPGFLLRLEVFQNRFQSGIGAVLDQLIDASFAQNFGFDQTGIDVSLEYVGLRLGDFGLFFLCQLS